ncbi:MAG: hypothetical protein SVZ03_05890 [Spirochaetota bacterium]|nr:hypothetical protein [Spirochaetota bacterium]
MDTTFYSLATKRHFNKSLNHFFKVNEIVEELELKGNLADIVDEQLNNNELLDDQILPIIGAVVKDKFGYSFHSFIIPTTITDFNKIQEETSKWTTIDIIMVYYDPNGKIALLNPKNLEHWERVRELTRDQLIIIYTKYLKSDDEQKIEFEAISAIEEMIAGRDVFINQKFIDHTVITKKKLKKDPTIAGQKRSTPKYSVLVTNELFHNGNVEAWKKIIESFTVSHPDLEVAIFYEGEVINNINTLFKWGKVKNGCLIFFQVIGEEIRDVSKLQKYLFEGASPRFEQFLKLGVGKILKLF